MSFVIKVAQRASFRVPRFDETDMRSIGQQAIASNFARWDKAINVFDQRAKGLQVIRRADRAPRGYAIQKQRKVGRNIRDWRLTGAMRAGLGILDSTTSRVRVGWSDGKMLLRARINQKREQMFGISLNDEKAILSHAFSLIRRKLRLAE